MVRFLHSADLHLGKPYGFLPEGLRGRLREARHAALERLATQARQGGAEFILLAGDVFDSETPSPAVLRQALAAMAAQTDLRWVLLPGNHDSLAAEALWGAVARDGPANVTLATEPVPLFLSAHLVLLPAPCTTRRPGRDLTDWMGAAATPEGVIRVGLAHGPVQSFSEDGIATDVIAPDRPARAGLAYLALGDWHGQMRIGPRCWYSGAPEPDRFKHDAIGRALLVDIATAAADPVVAAVATGQFDWRTLQLACLPDDDSEARLADALPIGPARRQTLLRVIASGRAKPPARTALASLIGQAAPEFALLDFEAEGLLTECAVGDLDSIDRAGALRQAADGLWFESQDERLPAEQRQVARDALTRLFSYCDSLGR